MKEVFIWQLLVSRKILSFQVRKQVEMFVDAIEASAKNRPVRTPVAARFVSSDDELIEFLNKREKANVGK